MGWAESHSHVFVIARALILVAHQHGDRSAQRCGAIKQSAQHLNAICFLARCGDVALAWPAAIQFPLNLLQV